MRDDREEREEGVKNVPVLRDPGAHREECDSERKRNYKERTAEGMKTEHTALRPGGNRGGQEVPEEGRRYQRS